MSVYNFKSKDEVIGFQNSKLKAFISGEVANFHPHYKALFKEHKIDPRAIRSIQDLERIPFTTKQDLMANPKNFLLQPDLETLKGSASLATKLGWLLNGKERTRKMLRAKYFPSFTAATSGRTSTSTPIFFTKTDLEFFKKIYAKNAVIGGIGEEDSFISLFPYAPHLAFWIVYFATEELGMMGINTGAVLGTVRQIELAQKFNASVLAGTPTYIHHFLANGLEQKASFKNLKRIITGGERLPLPLRERIEEMVSALGGNGQGCVRDGYGVVESKLVAMECAPHSGYHVNPEVIIWECVDPKTGRNLGFDKGGALAFTHINNSGTVLLRYLIGDDAEGGITLNRCEHCKLIVPRILGPLGRSNEYCTSLHVTKIKGTTVNLNSLLDYMCELKPVQEFRILLARQETDNPYSLDKMTIEVAVSDTEFPEIRNKILCDVKGLTEISPEICRRTKDEISNDLINGSLKGNKIVDLRK